MNKTQIITTLAVAIVACTTRGQYLEVNIASQCNADLQTYTDGTAYQLGGTQLTAGGVPFGLSLLDGTPGTTGIIQAPDGTAQYTFSVPAGTYGTELYTLINSEWGESGENEGTVVVKGSLGETATLSLTVGSNVRDHYDGVNCNTLSDPTVVPTYFINQQPNPTNGLVRLDRQELALPAAFASDTIASITFNGIGHGDPFGDPLLAAITLETVPEPSTFVLFGLGALAALRVFRPRKY